MLLATPSLAGYSLMITPSTSMPCNAMIFDCVLLLDVFSFAKLTKISLNGKYTWGKNQKRAKIVCKNAHSKIF